MTGTQGRYAEKCIRSMGYPPFPKRNPYHTTQSIT